MAGATVGRDGDEPHRRTPSAPADERRDYQRLRDAFAELVSQGYAAPLGHLWSVCCQTCGWNTFDDLVPEDGEVKGVVFAHQQGRERAFPLDAAEVRDLLAPAQRRALDGETKRALALLWKEDQEGGSGDPPRAWVERNLDFAAHLAVDDWMSGLGEKREPLLEVLATRPGGAWGDLQDTLCLYWDAPDRAGEVVAALRTHGLRVDQPRSGAEAIRLLPPSQPIRTGGLT